MTTPEDKQRQNWRELEKDIYLSSPQPVLDAVSPLLHTLTDEDKARLDELRADQQPSASRNPAYDWIVQQFKQVTLPATEQAPVKLAPSRKGRVYVAGPMTGIKDFNFPAFNQAAEELRTLGLTVLNPADHGVVEGATWADYLRHDIALLSTCERIHLLPGWPKSKGARLELHIAKTLGMEITTAPGAELVAEVELGDPWGSLMLGGSLTFHNVEFQANGLTDEQTSQTASVAGLVQRDVPEADFGNTAEPKLHSPEWFAAKRQDAAYRIASLPEAMKQNMHDAAATLPAATQPNARALHLFEFWWAEYMPEAVQSRAWAAWTDAQNSKGATIQANQPATTEHLVYEDGSPGPATRIKRNWELSDREIWRLWDSQERTGLVGGPCPVKFARDLLANTSPQVPEIDYTALIRAAWSNHKYSQGTNLCIAFKHGAEWFRKVAHDTAQGKA